MRQWLVILLAGVIIAAIIGTGIGGVFAQEEKKPSPPLKKELLTEEQIKELKEAIDKNLKVACMLADEAERLAAAGDLERAGDLAMKSSSIIRDLLVLRWRLLMPGFEELAPPFKELMPPEFKLGLKELNELYKGLIFGLKHQSRISILDLRAAKDLSELEAKYKEMMSKFESMYKEALSEFESKYNELALGIDERARLELESKYRALKSGLEAEYQKMRSELNKEYEELKVKLPKRGPKPWWRF